MLCLSLAECPLDQEARAEIDKLLTEAGWSVQRRAEADLTAASGVAHCRSATTKAPASKRENAFNDVRSPLSPTGTPARAAKALLAC